MGKEDYEPPTSSDIDAESNLLWNRQRWGQSVGWTDIDAYGYRWGGGYQQSVPQLARLVDTFLQPYLPPRWDLKVLEISPGAGRFTAELIRFAKLLVAVDMNDAAISICRERFKYYPTEIRWLVNDGRSLQCVDDVDFDLIASYDSMVHMHPTIVEGYIRDASVRLAPGGLLWIDHSGRGERRRGHRTSVSAESVRSAGEEAGLSVLAQLWRNDWDCISVFSNPGSRRV